MLSMIIGGALCVCSAYIGLYIAKKYRKTLIFCNEWKEFNAYCRQNIYYLKKPLGNIIDEFASNKKSEFSLLIRQFKEKKSFDESQITKSLNLLKNSEKVILKDYFFDLGLLEWGVQIDKLDFYSKHLEKVCTDAKIRDKNNGALACKLGVIFGIAIMIVLA